MNLSLFDVVFQKLRLAAVCFGLALLRRPPPFLLRLANRMKIVLIAVKFLVEADKGFSPRLRFLVVLNIWLRLNSNIFFAFRDADASNLRLVSLGSCFDECLRFFLLDHSKHIYLKLLSQLYRRKRRFMITRRPNHQKLSFPMG